MKLGVQAKHDVPQCGMHGENIRANCSLPEGHVRTRDDWHEADAESAVTVKSNTFEHTTATREHFRWAPNLFELPKAEIERGLRPRLP
jgi:hypothetical protein